MELSESTDSAAKKLVLRPVCSLTPEELAALERLAHEYGQSPDAYLALESDRHCFLTPDHSAAMSVIPSGKYLHISGGILAPESARRQIVHQLGEYSRQTKCLIACYSIREQDRELFEEAGWEVTKFGEDTTLFLSSHSWSGKAYEWVRRQANSCQRAGLTCREVFPREMDTASWQSLTDVLFEIQRDDLRDRVYPQEISLLVGKLQPAMFWRRRLFLAEDSATSRIMGFVVANPLRGGKGWALETFRKRQDAPRGAVPFLIKWIVDLLKSEGVEEVSLCLLLWKDTLSYTGRRRSWLLYGGLWIGYHLGDLLYNTKGMTHFKTRFRPTLTNSYLCVTPKTTIFSILNFFAVTGGFSLSPRNLLRAIWRSLAGPIQRLISTKRESD
jgi:phosphatidylglycerol lysyltransferase